jgi:hypothetical protein
MGMLVSRPACSLNNPVTRPGILAKTGNQCNFLLDSRLRGNDRRLRSPTHGAVDPDISNIFPGRDISCFAEHD